MYWQDVLVYGQLVIVLAIAAYTDWKYRKVYNVLSMPALIALTITRLFIHPQGWSFYIVALLPALLYYILALLTKEVGGGDILMAAYVGISSGVVATMLSVINAGLLGFFLFIGQAMLGGKKPTLHQPWVSLLFIGFCLSVLQIAGLQKLFPFINPWG